VKTHYTFQTLPDEYDVPLRPPLNWMNWNEDKIGRPNDILFEKRRFKRGLLIDRTHVEYEED
jgi:hypothetical protein